VTWVAPLGDGGQGGGVAGGRDNGRRRPPREYGVKLVRGPFLRLEPHPGHRADAEGLRVLVAELRAADPSALLAADLFSGAGGLSLGLTTAGMQVVFSVDHDAEAVETHRHHFPGMGVDWDLADPAVVDRVGRLLGDLHVDVLAGGPPCQPFSRAGRSMIRELVRDGLRDPHDQRRDLWRSYLEVVRLARPRAVVMENVPDMALDREMFILRELVEALELDGYTVRVRVVDTWRHGVPQFRERLILVALRDGLAFTWPQESGRQVSVWNAIGDLPEVEGGWRPDGGEHGWSEYAGPSTSFQRRAREGVPPADGSKVFDHITRPVREDDARAFQLMGPGTRYSDLPEEFKRYRDDIFDDKYKRLDEDDLSRTITAHIARDGYWYIHPRQDRTITVREAARLQTFPDRWRFAGPPSSAFRQIGNAVPPALGEALGAAVRRALSLAQPERVSSRSTAGRLAGWLRTHRPVGVPWLEARTRWQVVQAEMLLDRAPADQVRFLWPLLEPWTGPRDTLANGPALRELAGWVGREKRADEVLQLAADLGGGAGVLDDAALREGRPAGLPGAAAELARLVVDDPADEEGEPVLVLRGALRVAVRFWGAEVERKNRLTDGRLLVAGMIGGGENARDAHLALLELAATLCRPDAMLCTDCPLAATCRSSSIGPAVAPAVPAPAL